MKEKPPVRGCGKGRLCLGAVWMRDGAQQKKRARKRLAHFPKKPDQAMNTAIKASRKISRAPTTGITTGMECTMLSSGSAWLASCAGVGLDMVFPS